MRYTVDGKKATKAEYDAAPPGVSKGISYVDDDATIIASYRKRIAAIDEKKPDPSTKAELQAEITRLGG